MYPSSRANDSVHWYMSELTSRVVAESGIPSDRHHLGKILLRSFKDDPDFVLQIDGATGQSETNASVLERTVRCAIALKNLGLQCGDVMTLMAPNHIDLAIPFYAAMYMGIIGSPIDRTLGVDDLQANFEVTRPKVVFCQSERAQDVRLALNKIKSDAFIVTFDKGDFCSFSDFLETYGDKSPVEEFKPTDFDPEDTIVLLISTSGTTGIPKSTAATHKNFAITGPHKWGWHSQFPHPTKMTMVVSHLQWATAILNFLMSPILRFTRLQTSLPLTRQHTYELINTYKPTHMIVSPTFLTTLLVNPEERERECDFSCFEIFNVGGSAVAADLMHDVKKAAPNAEVLSAFGMSEANGLVFLTEVVKPGFVTVGKPMSHLQYRLIDIQSHEDIREPNRNGELWIRGPGVIKGYYRNPEATAASFTEDGWFKTGDMFFRDEQYNFFFMERIKLLLKFMSHQISPLELETTIRQHPGVLDVAVTGIPDLGGELPVACVVRRPGHDVSASEIKDLVKDKLAESKQLRGGVIFLDAIPQTASTKIHRTKLKEIAMRKHAEH